MYNMSWKKWGLFRPNLFERYLRVKVHVEDKELKQQTFPFLTGVIPITEPCIAKTILPIGEVESLLNIRVETALWVLVFKLPFPLNLSRAVIEVSTWPCGSTATNCIGASTICVTVARLKDLAAGWFTLLTRQHHSASVIWTITLLNYCINYFKYKW